MDKTALLDYVRVQFGASPEYLWKNYPDYFVFRRPDNRKWFAAVMNVQREKLGLSGDGAVNILDVKCGAILSGSYLGRDGFLPAYHMNKTHWIGILLDGTVSPAEVKELLTVSYDLTAGK